MVRNGVLVVKYELKKPRSMVGNGYLVVQGKQRGPSGQL